VLRAWRAGTRAPIAEICSGSTRRRLGSELSAAPGRRGAVAQRSTSGGEIRCGCSQPAAAPRSRARDAAATPLAWSSLLTQEESRGCSRGMPVVSGSFALGRPRASRVRRDLDDSRARLRDGSWDKRSWRVDHHAGEARLRLPRTGRSRRGVTGRGGASATRRGAPHLDGYGGFREASGASRSQGAPRVAWPRGSTRARQPALRDGPRTLRGYPDVRTPAPGRCGLGGLPAITRRGARARSRPALSTPLGSQLMRVGGAARIDGRYTSGWATPPPATSNAGTRRSRSGAQVAVAGRPRAS